MMKQLGGRLQDERIGVTSGRKGKRRAKLDFVSLHNARSTLKVRQDFLE